MGGGGGGGRPSLGDTKGLEEKAKEILRKGQSGLKNVFISFAHEDEDEVNLLRAHAANEKIELEFKDFSVKEPYESKRSDYIKQKIRERIRQSSVTIVYLSDETPNSHWVRWEVEESLSLGTTVIATHKGDTAPKALPGFVAEKKLRVVPWAKLSQELGRE